VSHVLAIAGVLVLLPGAAQADASLGGMEVEAVSEAEHRIDVRIDGLIATVETRQVIVNQGDRDTEVFYAFDLPASAAIDSASIVLADGRRATSTSVDARSAFRFVDEDAMHGAPDMGLLRMVNAPSIARDTTRYELRLYPIAAGKSATVAIRWLAPLDCRDGRLSLRIPTRGEGRNLVRERVSLRWRAPASATVIEDIRATGAILSRSAPGGRAAPFAFDAPAGVDLTLEARPTFRATRALTADVTTVPLDAGRGAVALTLWSARQRVSSDVTYQRIILAVDVSRSMGQSGRAAAQALADDLLAAATPSATAQVILFDRRARLLDAAGSERAQVRRRLAADLSAAGAENGSDLGAALGVVSDLARKTTHGASPDRDHPSTLLVVLTDGMLPLELDAEQAVSRIGTTTLADTRVVSVLLVPDLAPVPALGRGPLAELASRTGGRVIAVRHGEAKTRAAGLWREVGQASPLAGLEVDWGGATFTASSAVPESLEAGDGVVLFGWYHGRRPKRVSVSGELRGQPLTAVARTINDAAATRRVMPLVLVSRPARELLSPAALDQLRTTGGSEEAAARVDQVRAAHRAGVVTSASSLVIVDGADGFARDRLALARKWGLGQYRRFPPPAERAIGEVADREHKSRPVVPSLFVGSRRTGELDRVIIERLMKQYLVPRARACYERALRRDQNLAGTATVELEMVRGEVQDARLARSNLGNAVLTSCLIDAAYATPVPPVALGDTGEVVVIARYPLRFRKVEQRIDVGRAPDASPSSPVDPDDPLGGLDR
jgi:Mg-chelatase subunit ChlD